MCNAWTEIRDAAPVIGYDMCVLRNDKTLLIVNRNNDVFSLLDLSNVKTNDLDGVARLIKRLVEEAGEALTAINVILQGDEEIIDGEIA